LFKNLRRKTSCLLVGVVSFYSCTTSPSVNWKGKRSTHVATYMKSFDKFRKTICVPKAEEMFTEYLKEYRGQGYWIPRLGDDVDVESIKTLLPEFEAKLKWISQQKKQLEKSSLPSAKVTQRTERILKDLLALKKAEMSENEKLKISSRQKSLKLLGEIEKSFAGLTQELSFFTNFRFPVDHLKNRKVYDQYREKEDLDSIKVANYTFLYRKLLEDGAYLKNHTSSDIYLRTTLDTLHYELKSHGFYLTEDARFDLQFVLAKIESELSKGKERILERLTEWEDRTERALTFYKSLTLPDNQKVIIVDDRKTTPNKELIKQYNHAAERLKEFVYTKQAEVYKYWLNQPELTRAVFVLETILLNEVGGVDGDDALERQDVARVVMNRLDKPQYLSIGEKEFIYPYLKNVTSDFHVENERWLNALFKQGEFSFTYYYMNGVSNIFCPDISPLAKKLRAQNVEIALQVLKEAQNGFKTTRYFSRASMIGRIHMDSIWEDYLPYPERAGLLAAGQNKLIKALLEGKYTYLYTFVDPEAVSYQVLEIQGKNYALTEKNGVKLFYDHRNPHYFRYFTQVEKAP
jgi:hypothetical protein